MPTRYASCCRVRACALRRARRVPINDPISQVNRKVGYRLETRAPYENEDDTLIILAFSGGGTRAAAFAYGVLEELRRTAVTITVV